MKSNAYYIRALLGVVAFTALMIMLFGRPHTGGSDFWQASSYNPGERGHKAFYTTLEELHWPVARWQGAYRELSGKGQVMIMARNALGRRYILQPVEIDQLAAWIHSGNRLILMGDFADSNDAQPLWKKLDFHAVAPLSAGERLYEQGSELLSTQRKSIPLAVRAPEPASGTAVIEYCPPLPPGPDGSRFLLSDSGLPYAMEFSYGNGSVILIASPSLIDNHFLPDGSNLPFVLNLLEPGGVPPQKIWFEEAHHGYRTTFAVTDLFRHTGVQLAAGQIAIGLLVFLSGQLFRFGPIRPLKRDKARSTLEFVNSLANLYRRANLRDESVEALFHETHQAILRKFNLPERTGHDVLARRLLETFPHLPKWKKLAQRFDSDDYVQGLPPGGWLKVSRDLILIKNAMI